MVEYFIRWSVWFFKWVRDEYKEKWFTKVKENRNWLAGAMGDLGDLFVDSKEREGTVWLSFVFERVFLLRSNFFSRLPAKARQITKIRISNY